MLFRSRVLRPGGQLIVLEFYRDDPAGTGEFKVAVRPTETEELVDRLDSIADKLSWAVILAALILGTAILLSRSDTIPDQLLLIIEIVAILGIATVAWMLISAFRRGRRKRRR